MTIIPWSDLVRIRVVHHKTCKFSNLTSRYFGILLERLCSLVEQDFQVVE
jgi:hypothetical protein